MANIICAGGGATVTMLASLTSIPTSSKAVSGTENWKTYDAIYFECFMHYTNPDDKSVLTNLIFTNGVSPEERYEPILVYGAGGNGAAIDLYCYFSGSVISVYKQAKIYDVMKLNIYGVNF